jgi:hypothetical protein
MPYEGEIDIEVNILKCSTVTTLINTTFKPSNVQKHTGIKMYNTPA